MSGSAEPVLLAAHGAVATVTINRPEARNSLVPGMGGRIYGMLRRIADDPSLRVVILRGAGGDFCPGADMKAPVADDEEPRAPDFDAYQVSVLLHEMPQVSIAAIRGGCAGAGFGWACACDMRVGDESVRMNTAFLDVGVAGDMAVPWTLPRLIGAARARDLMFFPRKIGADEALALGVLQRLWPADAFEAELAALAGRLADAPPLALAAMKANFVEGERTGLAGFAAVEAERHIRLLGTEDRKEAFRAWIEKRKGHFKGR